MCHDYQAILCDGEPVIKPDPPEPVDWADKEFGQAELYDHRRVIRLLTLARDFYQRRASLGTSVYVIPSH
ncbi:hypothetical protein JW935_18175 [candidate division KSB1 bacterium]|nr:hypothetical protein [candidate division KSB1 bacterium]